VILLSINIDEEVYIYLRKGTKSYLRIDDDLKKKESEFIYKSHQMNVTII
jgi:hypothetical protein